MLSTSRAQEGNCLRKSVDGTSKELSPSARPDCIVRIARTGSRSRTGPIAKPKVGTISSSGSRRLEVQADELARSIQRSEGHLHRRHFGIRNNALEAAERIAGARKISKAIRDRSSQSRKRAPSVATGASNCFPTRSNDSYSGQAGRAKTETGGTGQGIGSRKRESRGR